MPPSIAAALVAALISVAWLLGRRRVPLLTSTDTRDVAALNRAQIALVQAGGASQPELPSPAASPRRGRPLTTAAMGRAGSAAAGPATGGDASLPLLGPPGPTARAAVAEAGGREAYRSRLETLSRGDRQARLEAVQAAQQWGDRCCLPLLRRALRDTDPAVIRAAALAMERFRGRSVAPPGPGGPQRPALPRRVARTR